MWNLLDRLLTRRNEGQLKRLIREAEGVEGLCVGAMVRYKAELRPAVVCPQCEVSDKSIGEPSRIEACTGKVGVVVEVIDPRNAESDVECASCGAIVPAPQHFRELGITVRFKTLHVGDPAGVWAFPSELTVISHAEYDRGDIRA